MVDSQDNADGSGTPPSSPLSSLPPSPPSPSPGVKAYQLLKHEIALRRDFISFIDHLFNSKRIAALLGAGLSVPSGIPTFRLDPTKLASEHSMDEENAPVSWQFWADRRRNALEAKPNLAHFALAELAKKKDFLAISQNIDGLCERAGHPSNSLVRFHGCMFHLKCHNALTIHMSVNTKDPIVPALAIKQQEGVNNEIRYDELPICKAPHCRELLRPDVVFYGEAPAEKAVHAADAWYSKDGVDLMLVIGTTAVVRPACDYIDKAMEGGAKVAIINLAARGSGAGEEADGEAAVNAQFAAKADWYFQGDVAAILPALLREVVGSLEDTEEEELAFV
ncbi:DHS-like NAD/FAD-binding domain-containing protein [Rhizodiscina lignyota]|uniref:DHS-like NAD/FAD-binding domain-containing protein n=1 Tax=Rhizodiscina lignyota TaxID=1504668 RepID=A0A9P4MDN6_9PEZI|nr:DHS-like NAD/FAD-binding domain-containing protein [Rhizodiscina lignyota]